MILKIIGIWFWCRRSRLVIELGLNEMKFSNYAVRCRSFYYEITINNLSGYYNFSMITNLSRYCLGVCRRLAMTPNGPAIWGGCVTRRQHRAMSWYFSQKAVMVQGGYGTCFCRHGTSFIEHYACRGTK